MFKAALTKADKDLPYERNISRILTAVDEASFIPAEAKEAVKNRIRKDSAKKSPGENEGEVKVEILGWCHGLPTAYAETTVPQRPIITFESGHELQLDLFDY